MDRGIIDKLEQKLEANRAVCRRLLIQLSDLPGCLCVAHDDNPGAPPTKRDLSRLLNEQVKQTEFLQRWVELAQQL